MTTKMMDLSAANLHADHYGYGVKEKGNWSSSRVVALKKKIIVHLMSAAVVQRSWVRFPAGGISANSSS